MVSVVINTLNEEKNIRRAILSVKKWADEIIVVDMESSDGTVSISEKEGARVYSHKKENYVEPARNFAINKTSGDWIFILDADEEATPQLLEKLKEISQEGKYSFVRIPRKNIIFNKWMKHSRWWPDENIRFFKKRSVVWGDEIHSVPVTSGDGISLQSEEKLAIIHHHYQSVEQYIERLNRYTTIQANILHEKGKFFSVSDTLKRTSGEFLSRYFAGEGYKDGWHGLVLALLQAFSEAVVYAKLWQIEGFTQRQDSLPKLISEIKNVQKDINYWTSDTMVKNGGGLTHKIKRKFKIL